VLVRGAEVDPTNPDLEYQLSLLFSRAGNSAEARQHMDRFRKLKTAGSSAGKKRESGESVQR